MTAGKFPKDTSHFKLLVSDFDGTLAGIDHLISKKVQDAIKRWIDSGRHFTIASGRQYLMIGKDTKALGLNTPLIVRGGAEIVDPTTHRVLYSQLIDKNIIKEFTNLLGSKEYGVMVEVGDTFYGNFVYDLSDYPLLKFKRLEELPYEDAPKINLRVSKDKVKETENFMDNIITPKFPQLHMVRSYNVLGMSYDITSQKATKHLAVLELIKMLGLKREETVGVGDGYNDFPLLEASGFKVAMGNAREELKEIADVIIPSQEENGVAYLIDKLLS